MADVFRQGADIDAVIEFYQDDANTVPAPLTEDGVSGSPPLALTATLKDWPLSSDTPVDNYSSTGDEPALQVLDAPDDHKLYWHVDGEVTANYPPGTYYLAIRAPVSTVSNLDEGNFIVRIQGA